jgi:uncharacterized DUF497 family protein
MEDSRQGSSGPGGHWHETQSCLEASLCLFFSIWDEANIAHIAEHDVLPSETEEVITSNPLDLGQRTRNGEDRLMQIGPTLSGRVLVVITTLRGVKTRVVTAFPASRAYRAFYLAQKDRIDHGKADTT